MIRPAVEYLSIFSNENHPKLKPKTHTSHNTAKHRKNQTKPKNQNLITGQKLSMKNLKTVFIKFIIFLNKMINSFKKFEIQNFIQCFN